MHFGKSYVCSNQLDVSETNVIFAQFSRIRNHFLGRRIEVGRYTPALDLWDLIVAVLHGNTYQSNQERRDPCTNLVRAKPHKPSTRKKSHGMINDLDNVDFIPSKVNSSHQEALLCVCEDNEAVIKMIIKVRSPTMRHVSRTHRTELLLIGWLFDRINWDPKSKSKTLTPKTNSLTY